MSGLNFHTNTFRMEPRRGGSRPTQPAVQSFRRNSPLRDFPGVSLYGNFPYQYYQPLPAILDEPNFILVTPKSIVRSKARSNREREVLSRNAMRKSPAVKPEKLRKAPQMDIKLVQAVQQPNSKFVIEKFFFVPGQRIAELSTAETIPVASFVKSPSGKVRQLVKSEKLRLQKQVDDDDEETATVKVESIGMSAADQPIPDYSAYFPRSTFTQPGSGEQATLILEPNSKAISGNDGTSISTPISRAILRRGTSVQVLFRPQSVAISGANGISHAQADLILDFIEDE
jgi:Domain of unknown function (DUF4774)